MLYFSGIIIAFFLAIVLFSKKNKTISDKILSLWLFFIGIHLLLYYLKFSKDNLELPFLLGLELPLPLVHAPFLYLYTASLCYPRPIPLKRQLLHFIPALACYLYMIHFYTLPASQKIWVYQNKGAGYELFGLIRFSAIVISGICYVVLSGLLLRQHEKNIHNLFSYEEKINLKWLRYLIAGMTLIWLAIFVAKEQVVFATVVLFVLFIGNFGIRQVGIFTNIPSFQPPLTGGDNQTLPLASPDFMVFPENDVLHSRNMPDEAPQPAPEPDKRKYQKSGLTEVSANNLHQQLKNLVETQKLYKESELSLTDLAERLKTHPNYISQVINEKEGKNFFDYINTKRIEEFLTMSADPGNRRFTLLALALDCGFNSKSSFIRYFKKVTGHAPSRYLQAQE